MRQTISGAVLVPISIIWILCLGIDKSYGTELSQYFDLPFCCYGANTYPDSATAYSLKNEHKTTNVTEKRPPSIGLYKMVLPVDSTVPGTKFKRNINGSALKLEQFDSVNPQQIHNNRMLPREWQDQLRQALFQQMTSSKPNQQKEHVHTTDKNTSLLWKQLQNASLEIIDPLTKAATSPIERSTEMPRNFSGVIVNTKSGLEIRTSASSSNLVQSGTCDCPLIQHGDMLLAYWSVNGIQNNNGEMVLEYHVYSVPHNVPTPPILLPFDPDLTFKPSPIDLNAEEFPPEIFNGEHSELIRRKHQKINFLEQTLQGPLPVPNIIHKGPPFPLPFQANINRLLLNNELIQPPPNGYTPGFLDWYRSALERKFIFPGDQISPLANPPPPGYNFNFAHPGPGIQLPPHPPQFLPRFHRALNDIPRPQQEAPQLFFPQNSAAPPPPPIPGPPELIPNIPFPLNPSDVPNNVNQDNQPEYVKGQGIPIPPGGFPVQPGYPMQPEFNNGQGIGNIPGGYPPPQSGYRPQQDNQPEFVQGQGGYPLNPSFNNDRPNSIQEIISGKPPLAFVGDKKHTPGVRNRISRECKNDKAGTNSNCKTPQPNSATTKSKQYTHVQPVKNENTKFDGNSKESAYILNF